MSDQNNSLYENSEYPSRRQAPRSDRRAAPPKRRRRRSRVGRVVGMFFKVLGTLMLVGLCTGALLLMFAVNYINQVIIPIADVSIDSFTMGENSIMYYQDKETGQYKQMVTLLNSTSSTWVSFADMPKNLINAAVAVEDKRFWEHPGVDWIRTGRAVLDMFTGNTISGGSTITQQLLKNQTNYNETTVKRKITEIVRALRFTQNNSKNDTITWYLNIIPLGNKYKGVGAAAQGYFGKSVSELTLAECASLISITNNPSLYGPYSPAVVENSRTGEMWDARRWNKWRQENVLFLMLDQGYITQAEYDEAVAQELVFVRGEDEEAPSTIYTWYEETVLSDVRADLKEKTGMSDEWITQMLAHGGLRIYTCMDPRVQAIAEEIYTNWDNLNYPSKKGQDMQSSITIIDNKTGDVAAIIGQFGEKTGNIWKNYANTSRRQPGSSFKPLAVYSPALELGKISPITVLDDYPYDDRTGSRGWPTNAGSNSYGGLTNIRTGLAKSLNTIAVRVLADLVTPQVSFDFVQNKYHIDLVEAIQSSNGNVSSDIDISPLAMGGLTYGVSTRSMATAYATFPNNGVYTKARTYTRVTQLVDGREVTLLENEQEQEAVIQETTAYYINSMLQGVFRSGGTAAGHSLPGMTCAGKTGTTNDVYDLWFVGYTPYYTAAIWTGYPENERMANDNRALSLWEKVMKPVHEGLEDQAFPTPGGLKSVNYCLDSGLRATEYCQQDPRGSRVASDKIFQEDFPDEVCTVHTAESVITVCVDDPVRDENGKETGLYHLSGPHCPEESLRQICYPNYEREPVGSAVARDEEYRMVHAAEQEVCTVHTDEVPVDPPEPVDPDPWGDPQNPGTSVDPSNPLDPNNPTNPVSPPATDPGTTTPNPGQDLPPQGGDDVYIPASQDIPVG